jgi:hypothetical protein
MNNVQCYRLLEVEGDKISAIDVDYWQVLWVSVFVLSCFFTGYELATIFMNDNILSSVAFLMGELCVVWSG